MLLSLEVFTSEKGPTGKLYSFTVVEWFPNLVYRVLFAQVVLFFPFFSSAINVKSSAPISRTKASYVYVLLVLMSVLSGFVTLFRFPSSSPRPFKPGSRIIQAGIWTVHFGFDNEGHDSQRGIRNLVRDMQLDIIGLLETDLHVRLRIFYLEAISNRWLLDPALTENLIWSP